MLTPSHLQTIQFTPDEWAVIRDHAAKAALGGQSRVFADRAQRLERLGDDQLVGQAGEAALSKWLTGTLDWYAETRDVRNAAPTLGDAGTDLLGANLDVKCSLMRASADPLRYRLLVRPDERHADTIYVLALVPPTRDRVILVGWARDSDLPPAPASDGPFAGAYVLPAGTLFPLLPFRITRWTSPLTTSTP